MHVIKRAPFILE